MKKTPVISNKWSSFPGSYSLEQQDGCTAITGLLSTASWLVFPGIITGN